MLSAETAIGVDPVGVVATMARIASRAEREFDFLTWGSQLGVQTVDGGAVLTRRDHRGDHRRRLARRDRRGRRRHHRLHADRATARSISRFRPYMPIVATTPSCSAPPASSP